MNEFKLKPNEIDILLNWGNTEDDIAQIEEGVNYATFKTNNNKKVDWCTAKRMVGTMNFLSGISRAAFHFTAHRVNDKVSTRGIYFDFSSYLND